MRIIAAMFGLVAICSFAACNGNNSSAPENSSTVKVDAPATITNAPPPANTQPSAAAGDRGRVLFQEKCAACHGLNGDAQGNNAANLPHSVLDSLAITQTIKNGRGTMPMFKDAIADSDIGHLAIYVKGLRK